MRRRRRVDKVEIAFPRKYLPVVNEVLRACEAADKQAKRSRKSWSQPRIANAKR
jgi:hypothetical protein